MINMMTTEKVLTLGDLSGFINDEVLDPFIVILIISHHIPPQHVIPVIMMASNGSSRLGNTQDIMTIY